MIHRTSVGSIEVTVLQAGAAIRTADELGQIFASAPAEALIEAAPEPLEWSFNLLLVRVGEEVLLADTGFAFGPGGPMQATGELLAEAGVAPADITGVVITHAHGDHVGGLLNGDVPAFPAANLFISSAELNSPMQENARSAIDAYSERIVPLGDADAVYAAQGDSVTLIPAPGHTPGHSGLRLESGGNRMDALVDTLHSEVQLAHPEWSPRFDADPALAERTRRTLLAECAESGRRVHFFHLAFPGIGYVEPRGAAYSWRPE
jgi:glyoxylase-like metal-dependent hydrolase (beta-lactamase superfamily II)